MSLFLLYFLGQGAAVSESVPFVFFGTGSCCQ